VIRKKRIKETEFKKIKTLLDAQIPVATISRVMDRSYATICRIKKTKNFKEYQDGNKAEAKERTRRARNTRGRKKVSTTTESESLDQIHSALVEIIEKLANIERTMKSLFWL